MFQYLWMKLLLPLGIQMYEIICLSKYLQKEAGTLMTVWVSGVIVGGIIGGPIVDKTRAYKPFMVCKSIPPVHFPRLEL